MPGRCNVRPCIPNFLPNFWVGYRVGTSFLRFFNFELNIIFCNFWKVRKSNFSETCKNENFGNFCLTQGLSTLLPPTKALHSELFTELSSRNEFSAIFEFRVECHFFTIFGKFGYQTFPKLTKMKSWKFLSNAGP